MFTKALVGTVLTLSLLGMGLRADNPKDKEEFKTISFPSLEGTWVVQEFIYAGVTNQGGEEWVYKGGEILSTSAGKELGRGTYRAIPGKEVGEIDFIPEGKGEILSKAIYKIEGDTLTVCQDGLCKGTRPTKFDASKGSDWVLSVLKRKKY